MGAQHGIIVLLIVIGVVAGGVSSVAADSAVCGADDPRQEYSDNDTDDRECTDYDNRCKAWSESGECANNPAYMLSNCRRSCNVCEHEVVE